ncbi:MAG: signal peptidase II [Deltaproteobacteria bacterium GWC2_56_8]|nr:MAG: signal peptidase II [Deltaproteobacteria bacterium GWB2_55_19]OGP34314.1 MAG: signal peptidase II [Deltaproteobacteria bacterium GWC2_56_8]HAO93957.1 signal peptidase II [Deltaproteobacteria bacterium]
MHGGAQIKNLRVLVITALAVLVVDQASKLVVIHYFWEGETVEVIAGFFDLVHFRNPGAAFGIFNEGGVARRVFLITTSGAALAVIFFLLKETKDSIVALGLSLVAGGAAGNLVDRVRFGSVVDFLYFHAGPYYWPAFNIADSAITAGVGLAAVFYWFRHR